MERSSMQPTWASGSGLVSETRPRGVATVKTR